MPTYEYACTSCGHHLEVFQAFSDEPLTTCPTCGGDLRKVFGSIGIVLKGSGFYRTDSRAASNGKAAAKDKDKDKDKDKKGTPSSGSASEPAAPSSGKGGEPAAPSSGTSTSASSPGSSGSDSSSKAAAAAG